MGVCGSGEDRNNQKKKVEQRDKLINDNNDNNNNKATKNNHIILESDSLKQTSIINKEKEKEDKKLKNIPKNLMNIIKSEYHYILKDILKNETFEDNIKSD